MVCAAGFFLTDKEIKETFAVSFLNIFLFPMEKPDLCLPKL